MQQLTQNSLFLKTCLLYLEEDEPDYLQLTECEFISVSKAYSLKNKYWLIFMIVGSKSTATPFDSLKWKRRLLLLNVAYRLGSFKSWELPESFLNVRIVSLNL